MKFNDLYNRVFVKEQDEANEEPMTTAVSEVPMP